MQAGNSIGGSISQDGRIVVAQNYTPGGIKAFDATLELLADSAGRIRERQVLQGGRPGRPAGRRFAYSLFDAGEIWITDLSNPARPVTTSAARPASSPTTRW
jgi:protein NirF